MNTQNFPAPLDPAAMADVVTAIESAEARGDWSSSAYELVMGALDAQSTEAYYLQGTSDGQRAIAVLESLIVRASAITVNDDDLDDDDDDMNPATVEDTANALAYEVEQMTEALDRRDLTPRDLETLGLADALIDAYNVPTANAALTDTARDALDGLSKTLTDYALAARESIV